MYMAGRKLYADTFSSASGSFGTSTVGLSRHQQLVDAVVINIHHLKLKA